MNSEATDTEMLGLAMDAYRAAVARVEAAGHAIANVMYAPLAEAVWWAICVDEEIENREGYKSRRNTDPQGAVVLGLRYARSLLVVCLQNR